MEYCKVSSTIHSLSTNNLFFNLKDPQCMDSWTVMPPGSGYNCELCWSVLFPLVKLFLAACWGGGGEGGGAVMTFDNCVWSNSWEILSKEALTLQPPPKNISSHTEKKSRAKRKRNNSLHYRNRQKIVRRNGEHGQNTQSIIHYAVKYRWRWYY